MTYLNCAIKCILRTIFIIMLSSNISYLFSVIKDLSCNCTLYNVQPKQQAKLIKAKVNMDFFSFHFQRKETKTKNGIVENFKVNLAEANK